MHGVLAATQGAPDTGGPVSMHGVGVMREVSEGVPLQLGLFLRRLGSVGVLELALVPAFAPQRMLRQHKHPSAPAYTQTHY